MAWGRPTTDELLSGVFTSIESPLTGVVDVYGTMQRFRGAGAVEPAEFDALIRLGLIVPASRRKLSKAGCSLLEHKPKSIAANQILLKQMCKVVRPGPDDKGNRLGKSNAMLQILLFAQGREFKASDLAQAMVCGTRRTASGLGLRGNPEKNRAIAEAIGEAEAEAKKIMEIMGHAGILVLEPDPYKGYLDLSLETGDSENRTFVAQMMVLGVAAMAATNRAITQRYEHERHNYNRWLRDDQMTVSDDKEGWLGKHSFRKSIEAINAITGANLQNPTDSQVKAQQLQCNRERFVATLRARVAADGVELMRRVYAEAKDEAGAAKALKDLFGVSAHLDKAKVTAQEVALVIAAILLEDGDGAPDKGSVPDDSIQIAMHITSEGKISLTEDSDLEVHYGIGGQADCTKRLDGWSLVSEATLRVRSDQESEGAETSRHMSEERKLKPENRVLGLIVVKEVSDGLSLTGLDAAFRGGLPYLPVTEEQHCAMWEALERRAGIRGTSKAQQLEEFLDAVFAAAREVRSIDTGEQWQTATSSFIKEFVEPGNDELTGPEVVQVALDAPAIQS